MKSAAVFSKYVELRIEICLSCHLRRNVQDLSFAALKKMFFLLILFFLLVILKGLLLQFNCAIDLRTYLQPSVELLHGLCLQQTAAFQHNDAASALVCGANIDSLDLQSLFASTGLIHLLVVSGSHLLILQKMFDSVAQKMKISSHKAYLPPIKYFLLITFVMMCEFNAPVTRSLIALFLSDFIRTKKWAWSMSVKQWVTTFLSLFINPLWFFSLSFQMSWLSSLALDLSGDFPLKNKMLQNFCRSLLIGGSFVVIFCFLGFPSGWAPLISLAFSPVLELVLFPLALFGCIFNSFSFIFDFIFSITTHLLAVLGTDKHFLLFLDRATVVHLNLFMIIILIAIALRIKKVKT